MKNKLHKQKKINLKRIIRFILVTLIISANSISIHAQTIHEQVKKNIKMNNVTVQQLVDNLKSNFDYSFFIVDEQVAKTIVSVDQRNATIEKILDKAFQGKEIVYNIRDKNITISIKDVQNKPNSESKRITGFVYDENKQPVIGANVMLKNSKSRVITDENGEFSLLVPETGQLEVTYIGYNTRLINLDGNESYKISLDLSSQNLNEVVVVGFGTQKKVNLTGAVAVLDEKALDSRPIQNVSEGLQGVVAGLNITQGGEGLSGKPQINIRGLTTIGQGSSGAPLILIDGMEGDISTLNPNDIESMSVLKDAAASAIYGSRAPFGVILVTTKAGHSGEMQINYNLSLRSNAPIVLPQQLNSTEFVNLTNLGFTNEGNTPFFNATQVQRVLDYAAGKLGKSTITQKPGSNLWDDGYSFGNDNVNWYQKIYKSSTPSQEHTLSVSGGSKDVTFYLAGDYLNQEGLMALNQDVYDRYTINGKLTAKLNSWASLTYNTRFTRENNKQPAALNGNLYGNLGRQAWPTLPFYDPNGFLYSSPSPALSLRDGGNDKTQTDHNIQQVTVTIEPIKGWKTVASLNSNTGDFHHHWDVLPMYNHDVNGVPYYASQGWYFGTNNTIAHEDEKQMNYFTSNIYTEYSKDFGKHSIKVMAGFQSELENDRSLTAERAGLIIPSLPSVDLTSGQDPNGAIVPPTVGGNYASWSTEGYFSRINYSFKDRYLVELDGRYDGSSRFRASQAWNFFPSASLGWIVSNEEFWKQLENVVNFFKIRGSYGQLGNQNLDNWYPTYQSMPVGTANSYWLLNDQKQNTASSPGLISSTLTWEKIKTYNVGLDFAMFKNRLSGSFDAYVRYTDDMVGPAPELPAILGTGLPTTNNESLRTNGWELSIAWKDRLSNGLGYNVGLALSDSRSTITNYTNVTGTLAADGNGNVFYKGANYGDIWGYQTLGIANSQAQMDAHLAKADQTAIGNHWAAGDIMYADLNGDGKINNGANTLTNHGDLKVIGNFTPRYLFGITLGSDWKGFDFRAFLQGVGKRDYFQNGAMFWGESGPGIWGQILVKQALDYWTPTNLNAYYPRPLNGDGKNTQVQSRYLQNAAYLRLKNLQLGYTVPAKYSKKLAIQKCRFYVSGENILTFTKLAKMFDPETIGAGSNGLTGSGGDVYPLMKTYSCGLNITF
ncbi:MAG: TonB-dependent receptor [Paludibacter sp.]|nr:TonB-dependent receptor [Paludibacter sp.]